MKTGSAKLHPASIRESQKSECLSLKVMGRMLSHWRYSE